MYDCDCDCDCDYGPIVIMTVIDYTSGQELLVSYSYVNVVL